MKTFKSVLYMTRAFVFNILQTNVMKDAICLRHYEVTKYEKPMPRHIKSIKIHFKSIRSFLHDRSIVL